MAITTLDPNIALIIVDLQKGIIGLPVIHPIEPVIARSAALAAAFREQGLPVVLVNVAGSAPGRTDQPPRATASTADWTELVPELGQQETDITVTKTSWGAFPTTDLEARLKALGVTQVVVTGVATGTGVEATARQAYEAGFNVTLPVDAMTDTRTDTHDYSIAKVFPRLGETGSTRDVLNLLAERRV